MKSIGLRLLLFACAFCVLSAATVDVWASNKPVCPPPFDLQNGAAYGHQPYEVAPNSLLELVAQPPAALAAKQDLGRSDIGVCRLRPEAARQLRDLLAAAANDDITLYMRSCHRTRAEQVSAFCRDFNTMHERVLESAPPGFSEHHTGYALDFGDLAYSKDCQLEACFEGTPGNRWLQQHAASFGFERSFPENNAHCFSTTGGRRQCVTSEPWHWRYVGLPVQGRVPVRLFEASNAISPASPSPRR